MDKINKIIMIIKINNCIMDKMNFKTINLIIISYDILFNNKIIKINSITTNFIKKIIIINKLIKTYIIIILKMNIIIH